MTARSRPPQSVATLQRSFPRPVIHASRGILRSEWRQCGTFLTSGLTLPIATIGSEHPIGALLDRLTHRMRIMKINRESFR